MQITRRGSQPSRKGQAEYFTGNVRIDPLFQAPDPARAGAGSVTFEPGGPHRLAHASARSDTHHHCGGRLAAEPLEHWHGATPTTAITHIAVEESLDGKKVDWLEHVTDEQSCKRVTPPGDRP
jgi:quercetin dioxygenase-like cupin family protein